MTRKVRKPSAAHRVTDTTVEIAPTSPIFPSAKARYEACRRRKWTVFDKAIFLGTASDHDVLVLVRKNRTLDFYSSRPLNDEWPPTASHIVSNLVIVVST